MGASRRRPPPDTAQRSNSQKPLFLWIPKTVSFSGREKEMGFVILAKGAPSRRAPRKEARSFPPRHSEAARPKNPHPPSLCGTGILPQPPAAAAPSEREPKGAPSRRAPRKEARSFSPRHSEAARPKNPHPPSLCGTGILPQPPAAAAPSEREPKGAPSRRAPRKEARSFSPRHSEAARPKNPHPPSRGSCN